MIRFRPRDFEAVEHHDGGSPACPVTYEDMEPWYRQAEDLYHVLGTAGIDPTEGPRSSPFPFPGVGSDLPMQGLMERLRGRHVRCSLWNES